MPLLDHFRPPLSTRRHWHAFHNAWPTYLAAQLNRTLPDGYFAETDVQFGIKIDVAAFEEASARADADNGVSIHWTAPAPLQTIPLPLLSDIVEVTVIDQRVGPVLAGAIALVSPANKDRPAHRDAFISKCAALVQQGVGLMILDIVTDGRVGPHDLLLARLTGSAAATTAPGGTRRPAQSGAGSFAAGNGHLVTGQPLPAGRSGGRLRAHLPRSAADAGGRWQRAI